MDVDEYAVVGEWLAIKVEGCTCPTSDPAMYGHWLECGYEPLAKIEDLRLAWNTRSVVDAASSVVDLVAGLEALAAKYPGHVRQLVGPDLCDQLIAALSATAPTVEEPTDVEPDEGDGERVCALCGHEMTLDRCGYAGINEGGVDYPLCHEDGHDCYGAWNCGERPAPIRAGRWTVKGAETVEDALAAEARPAPTVDGVEHPQPPLHVGDRVEVHDGPSRRMATVKRLGNHTGAAVIVPDTLARSVPTDVECVSCGCSVQTCKVARWELGHACCEACAEGEIDAYHRPARSVPADREDGEDDAEGHCPHDQPADTCRLCAGIRERQLLTPERLALLRAATTGPVENCECQSCALAADRTAGGER